MAQSFSERYRALLVPAVYLVIAAILLARAISNAASVPLLLDTDDAMRMVVVRDFLAGQNWYDHVQYRMNTPWGGEMHWSRLVDLPIAGLILLFRPFFGAGADMIAAYAYPLILLGLMLAVLAALARELVGREGVLPAVVLPAFALPMLNELAPGRIDHHGLQMVLMTATMLFAVKALKATRFALLAGLLAATSLAVGTETLPLAAAAVTALGLAWVIAPRHAPAMRLFGLAFAAAAVLHLALYLPPSRWFEPACDALSIVFVLAAVGAGLSLVLLGLLPLARPWQRLGAGLVLGGALLTGLVLAYPDCLRGPYGALDPYVIDVWMSRITETHPLLVDILALSPFAIGLAVPLALGCLAVVLAIWRDAEHRLAFVVVAVFIALAVAVTLLQVRGGRLALPLVMPALAWLIVAARRAYLVRRSVLRILALLLAWLGSAGLVSALAAAALSPEPESVGGIGRDACIMPAAFADLAGLPPERIMTPIDLGAHMLLHTPHAVVSGPYHRNRDGLRDVVTFLMQPLEAQRPMLAERGIGLVVTCNGLSEMHLEGAAPDSFIALSAQDRLPAWLVDQSLPDSPLRVYAVLPQTP